MKSYQRSLLCLFGALIWFATLGARPLAHPDEGRYSEISREMALSGDWVTPRLNGLKYFEKPPLQYWVTAAAFKAFGESDFVARLWPGLCGFLTVLLLWRTARRLWGEETADYAAITGASMAFLMGMSHVVTLDMSVSFFMTLALCGFLRAHHDGATPRENRRWMLIVWAAMAGALLSKGLIGIVLPGAVLVLYSLICRHWKLWTRMQWISGLLIFFALAAPWHVLAALRNPEWAQFYFIHEHFERFLTTEHHRIGAWYYFVPVLLGGLLPWTTLLPQTFSHGWRAESTQFKANRFLLIWSVFIFVFFSSSGSKLPGYILPVFPALALLLAQMLAQARPKVLRWHAVALAIFMAGIAAAAPFFGRSNSERTPMEYNQAFAHWLLAGAALFALAAAAAAWFAFAGRKLASTTLLAGGCLLFLSIVILGYRSYAPLSSSAGLADRLTPRLSADTPLFSVRYYEQTLPFYLKRTVTLVDFDDEFDLGERQEPEKWIPQLDDFARRWRELPRAIAVIDPPTFHELQQQGLPMQILDQNPRRVVVSKP